MTFNPIKKITYYTPRMENDPKGLSGVLFRLGEDLGLVLGEDKRIEVVVNAGEAKLVVEFNGDIKFSYDLEEVYDAKHEIIDHFLLGTNDPELMPELALRKNGM